MGIQEFSHLWQLCKLSRKISRGHYQFAGFHAHKSPVDNHFGAGGAIDEIIEGAPRQRFKVVVNLGCAVKPGRPQRHTRVIGLLYKFGKRQCNAFAAVHLITAKDNIGRIAAVMVGGVRHLIMDMGHWEELESGKLSAKITIALSVVLSVLAGVWLWF